MEFPWLQQPAGNTPTFAESFRLEVDMARSEEIQRLRLMNEYLRSEVAAAETKAKAATA